MDIVSYRGPNAPGGVSNALQSVFYDPRLELDGWWFFTKNRFKRLSRNVESSLSLSAFPSDLVESHYGYCNQYLWPILHGCPQYAEYDAKMRLAYRRANRMLAESIIRSGVSTDVFVHDYQLALLPRLLASAGIDRISFFWHIPWPAQIPEASLERIAEIASGIAASTKIGFQTINDANNFVRFCDEHLPELSVKHKVCVAPVAIDHELWSMLSRDDLRTFEVMQQLSIHESEKIVLSVERADYTKGVLERLDAIEHYLANNSDMHGNVRFIEIVPRTRPGVAVYDAYGKACVTRAAEINAVWKTPEWQPITWVDEPMSSVELATLYARADVMLINSIADGLNLAAKEFIACQTGIMGALVLSKECGVVSEIGDAAFIIDPRLPEQIAKTIQQSLCASQSELDQRMRVAQERVEKNNPNIWLARMSLPPAVSAKAFARVT